MLGKTKFLSILIILLFAANATTLVLFWMQKNKQPAPPKRGGAFQFLVKELNLTTEQQNKFEILRETHKQKMDSLGLAMREQKDSLFDGLKTPDLASTQKNYHLQKISNLYTLLDGEVFDHFATVRSFCTPEQQIQFDKVIKEAVKMPKKPNGPKPGERPYPEHGRPPGEEGQRPPPREGEPKH